MELIYSRWWPCCRAAPASSTASRSRLTP